MRLGLLEKERRRECGANIHAGHPADERLFPWHGTASIESRHRLLDDVEKPGDRPAEPDSRDQPYPLTHHRRHTASFCHGWLSLLADF